MSPENYKLRPLYQVRRVGTQWGGTFPWLDATEQEYHSCGRGAWLRRILWIEETPDRAQTDEKTLTALEKLRKLMGHHQNGTDQSVSLAQDDATGSLVLSLGRLHRSDPNTVRRFTGNSLDELINRAFEQHKEE